MHTIVITGGHHNSALVVARELIKQGHRVEGIGHRRSSRGDTSDSAEYLEVTSAGIPFHDLSAARLVLDPREIFRFPIGISTALRLLKRIRPSAILSFGGYLGGTVALAGKLFGIPIYLHEQTVTAGRANKLIGKLAKRVYLTWPESAKYFGNSKVQVVGLPLRESILKAKAKPFFTRRKPTLLVMGGKQGAHRVNQFIFAHLKDLLTSYNVIHQTGTNSVTHDYEKSLSLQNSLGSLSDCYLPLGYIGESEIGSYLHSVDLYFGRSGAHITYELGIIGLPAILVPLMSTHDHEQHKNASILVKSNRGVILAQSDLSLLKFMGATKELKQLKPKKLDLAKDGSRVLVSSFLKDLD